MTITTSTEPIFAGSIPKAYDTFLGPFLFEFYGADLAARLDVGAGGKILETSCGTAISTEHLRAATAPGVRITATDVSAPMLEFARSERGHLENVSFEEADAVELPYEDGCFDAVVSQFGLMFVSDKERAMREARRVLRPGGRLAFNVWGDLESNPYVQVAQDAIASCFDVDPPTFLYLPWSYSEPGPIEELLIEAGFGEIEIDVVPHVGERPTARSVAEGLVRGNPTITAIEARADIEAEDVVVAVAEALAASFGDEPFRAPMQAVVVTARRLD